MRDDKGRYATPENKELSQEMEELRGQYLASLMSQKTGTSDRTWDTRRREVGYWLEYCTVNGIDPLAAEESDIRGYIQGITPLADTTVHSYFTSIQSFYSIVINDAADDSLELVNSGGHPCDGISLKDDYGISRTAEYKRQNVITASNLDNARDNDDVIALRPNAVEKLFDSVPGKRRETQLRNEVIVRLSWYTGARSVELSGMRIENIDWDRCIINIESAKIDPRENPGLARRNVVFPKEFRLTLRRWCERVRHSFSGQVTPEEGHILCTTHSDEMQPPDINDVIKQTARNAGLQRPLRPVDPGPEDTVKEWFVTSHRLRRSAISHWVNDIDTIDINQARLLAGHAQLSQTIDYVEDDSDSLAEDYQRGMQA
ncbi:site-specific integrase [Natronomonas sp. F2-12]|uniref:Site-specific integrase n=1 Tax=Natronomonas aquatica TaxID=2841590 RepID=A0A9R1D7K0_9EURY|nr:site-specific integrase [Natronomonas aquatica]MCQ4334987.1 site-specific integrase [Natronomonas aquatica]